MYITKHVQGYNKFRVDEQVRNKKKEEKNNAENVCRKKCQLFFSSMPTVFYTFSFVSFDLRCSISKIQFYLFLVI